MSSFLGGSIRSTKNLQVTHLNVQQKSIIAEMMMVILQVIIILMIFKVIVIQLIFHRQITKLIIIQEEIVGRAIR